MVIITIVVLIIGGIILSSNLLTNHHLGSYTFSMLIIIGLGILQGPVRKLFVIENNSKLSLLYTIFYEFGYCVMIIAALFFFGSIKSLVFALVIVYLINTIFCFVYIKRRHGFLFFKYNKKILKQLIIYNIWPNLSRLLGRASMFMDKIIILGFLTSSDFAVYVIGSIQIPLINSFFSSLGEIILIRMSNISGNLNHKPKIIELYKKMVKTKALVSFPIITLSILTSQKIFKVFLSPEYLSGVQIFNIVNLIFFFQIFAPHLVIRSLGDTRPIFYSSITKFSSSIILGIPLVKYYGINGAAYTFSLTYFFGFVVQFYFSKKFLNCKLHEIIPINSLIRIISSITLASIIPLSFRYFLFNDVLYLILSILFFFSTTYFLNKKNYDRLINSLF
tara:strand:+ start:1171 stop:2343 length:1173 start_codon:yes stop_codon:yes gene_type:complete